jgi:branched-chain amino acid transport system substrate-binding protein
MRARMVCWMSMAVCLAACSTAAAETLDIYSSLPLHGPARSDAVGAVRGMRLALAEAGDHAGPFDIHYVSLDDSTAASGGWDPATTERNAHRAALDTSTILYLGEFNSGASGVSIPMLNQANIPQISPSNTYNGLTTSVPGGGGRGEPEKWYPAGRRTYFRIAARDTIQSAALLTQMKRDGCRHVTLADDGDVYGYMIAAGARRQARRVGVSIARYVHGGRRPASIAAAAVRAKSDCFLFGGVTADHAPAIYRAVAHRLPHARLYGGDGVCEDGFARRTRRIAGRFRCSILAMPTGQYPGGAAFAAAYAAAYSGAVPPPYAIFGYEAMKLGLDTISGLPSTGRHREALREALFAVRDRESVLGRYSIDHNGDTTLRSYGIYRTTREGRVTFDHQVVAG